MSDKKDNKYQFAKKELLKILAAVSVLMLVSLFYYFHIRSEVLSMAERRAESTLKNTERMILLRLGKIETIVNSIQPMVEYALDDPDAMFEIVEHTVESSPAIMGASIAFKEGYYPEKGRWFEPYYGHQTGSDTMVSMQLGSPNHDYIEMEWFKKGMASEDGCWSDPYYDNAGGLAYMMTYTTPVMDSNDVVVGVIGADITLDTLASILESIKIYPNSYCTLVAGDGTTLVAPPPTAKSGVKSHVFSEVVDDKNMTLTITIPDSDMYSRLRHTSLFFGMLALTGILTVFFVAYHSIQNLWKLNEVRIKEQHIEDELTIARDIQQALMPSGESLKNVKTVDVSGIQVPAKFVGGDLYDYYVRDNNLLFCIGDVSGKGVPAALLMAISHSLFRTLSARSDSPEDIVHAINNSISEHNPDMMFITMFLGIMNLKTGKISYCNAGHNPPIIIKGGKAAYIDTKPSLILGVEPNAKYTSYELTLNPNDTLFLYTDGLTEAENAQKELFGEQRALDTAEYFSALTSDKQLEQMQRAMRLFVDNAEQSDDLTMLAIRRTQVESAPSTLTLSNDINELEKLEPFLNKFFEENNLDEAHLSKINLALEEALANVIMYAYPDGEKGEVTLGMEVTGNAICMTISDNGIPFNPLQQKEANLDVSLEERQIGGLGIHLIKEIMDKVEYEYKDKSNILNLELGIK